MRVKGPGFRVQGVGLRAEGSGFRVQGSGFRVQGSGPRVQGSGLGHQRKGRVVARDSEVEGTPPLRSAQLQRLFKAHRLSYHSTLGLRVIKKKKKYPRPLRHMPGQIGPDMCHGSGSGARRLSLEWWISPVACVADAHQRTRVQQGHTRVVRNLILRESDSKTVTRLQRGTRGGLPGGHYWGTSLIRNRPPP